MRCHSIDLFVKRQNTITGTLKGKISPQHCVLFIYRQAIRIQSWLRSSQLNTSPALALENTILVESTLMVWHDTLSLTSTCR